MEKKCPKCNSIMCGECPDRIDFVVYICEECGYEESECIAGDLIDYAMNEMEDRPINRKGDK